MEDKYININKKVSVYTRRYKTEPKYLTDFLNKFTEEIRLEESIFSLEDFRNKFKIKERFSLMASKERISAYYVGGSIATKELAYYHPKFKTSIIVVSEHFESNVLFE